MKRQTFLLGLVGAFLGSPSWAQVDATNATFTNAIANGDVSTIAGMIATMPQEQALAFANQLLATGNSSLIASVYTYISNIGGNSGTGAVLGQVLVNSGNQALILSVRSQLPTGIGLPVPSAQGGGGGSGGFTNGFPGGTGNGSLNNPLVNNNVAAQNQQQASGSGS